MGCAQVGAQAHPVRDPLDETPRARSPAVVLEAVDQLVDQHAAYLIRARHVAVRALGGLLDPLDIVEAEVCLPASGEAADHTRMKGARMDYIRISLWSLSRSEPFV